MQHLDEGTIHAWIDGALAPERASAVEAHVAGCAVCAAAVAEARGLVAGASRILAALDHVPGGVVPASLAPAARARRWRRYTRLGSALAAAIAFVVVGSIALRQWGERGGVERRTVADAASAPKASVLRAPMPAEVRPMLPDAAPSAAPRAGAASGSTTARFAPPPTTRATPPSAPSGFTQRSVACAAEPARDSAPAVAMADVASAADSAATSAESAAGFAGRAPRQLPESVAASQPAPLMAKLAQRPAQGASAGADSALAPGVGAVVRGRVRSNDGEPISGASVAIGQVATFTQNDGTYILALPSTLVSDQPAVLRVRRIGYHAAADSLRLGSGRTITHDVTLTGQASMLSEVVVTRDDDARTARLRVSSPQRPQITLVRSDSVREGGRTVRRKIYEVRPGVRVTLAEAAMIADHQAPVDGRRAPVPAAVSPESSAVGVSSIQWTSDDGTECTLSGRLSIAELRKLKELLH